MGKGAQFDFSIINLRLAGAVLASGFLIAYLAPESHVFRARRRIRTDNPLLAGTIRFHIGVSDFLLLLIYAHVAFAFWHWFFREDGLWESMTGHSLNSIKDVLRARFLRILDRRYRLTSNMTSGKV
ncbi:MAG: hypothetical protein DMG30_07210 [Acidobacteria bacterium]|nr:MAG: hypothetical protein DMG30_07210 [Acidobacteriota bacterium]